MGPPQRVAHAVKDECMKPSIGERDAQPLERGSVSLGQHAHVRPKAAEDAGGIVLAAGGSGGQTDRVDPGCVSHVKRR